MKEDNISQLGDYDAPFCEQQYTHGSCNISLFKLKSFDQLIPPKLPQILDIYSVVALQRIQLDWEPCKNRCQEYFRVGFSSSAHLFACKDENLKIFSFKLIFELHH